MLGSYFYEGSNQQVCILSSTEDDKSFIFSLLNGIPSQYIFLTIKEIILSSKLHSSYLTNVITTSQAG